MPSFLKKTLSTRFDYINAELLIEFRKNWYRGDKIGFINILLFLSDRILAFSKKNTLGHEISRFNVFFRASNAKSIRPMKEEPDIVSEILLLLQESL